MRRTTDLKEAQKALGVGSQNSRQAIIPMVGSKAGDPHDLTKKWKGGSMWWNDWNDIKGNMQKKCSESGTLLGSFEGILKPHLEYSNDIEKVTLVYRKEKSKFVRQ